MTHDLAELSVVVRSNLDGPVPLCPCHLRDAEPGTLAYRVTEVTRTSEASAICNAEITIGSAQLVGSQSPKNS
jgi:hypothetical protein